MVDPRELVEGHWTENGWDRDEAKWLYDYLLEKNGKLNQMIVMVARLNKTDYGVKQIKESAKRMFLSTVDIYEDMHPYSPKYYEESDHAQLIADIYSDIWEVAKRTRIIKDILVMEDKKEILKLLQLAYCNLPVLFREFWESDGQLICRYLKGLFFTPIKLPDGFITPQRLIVPPRMPKGVVADTPPKKKKAKITLAYLNKKSRKH